AKARPPLNALIANTCRRVGATRITDRIREKSRTGIKFERLDVTKRASPPDWPVAHRRFPRRADSRRNSIARPRVQPWWRDLVWAEHRRAEAGGRTLSRGIASHS